MTNNGRRFAQDFFTAKYSTKKKKKDSEVLYRSVFLC